MNDFICSIAMALLSSRHTNLTSLFLYYLTSGSMIFFSCIKIIFDTFLGNFAREIDVQPVIDIDLLANALRLRLQRQLIHPNPYQIPTNPTSIYSYAPLSI